MRSFILGAVVCFAGLVAGTESASAQVVTYTTPYGGYSYTAAYPNSTVVPATTIYPGYVVPRIPYVAPYVPVTPYYPGYYYYNRPVVRTYYGPAYGWRW